MFVLSAGTGRVVQAIARELGRLPGPKRFLPAGTARGVVAGFEAITAGAADRAARARALEGARELVVLPTFDARATDAQCALVREAVAAGVRRIRLGSLIGADPRSPVCLLRWVGLLEREVISTGVGHDVLRCAPFMQNLSLFIRRDATGLTVAGPFRDAAFPWLDATDVGHHPGRPGRTQRRRQLRLSALGARAGGLRGGRAAARRSAAGARAIRRRLPARGAGAARGARLHATADPRAHRVLGLPRQRRDQAGPLRHRTRASRATAANARPILRRARAGTAPRSLGAPGTRA